MLQGVFYDLKQLRDRRKNEDFKADRWVGGWHMERVEPTLKIMRAFVNGVWQRGYDNEGRVHYTALDKYYSPPLRLWSSCFFSESIDADEAPKAYECDKDVNPAAWVCIYSGNVVAPFTGKFRFVGTADDVMFVRFNKEIVLDYGFASYSVGEYWTGSSDSNRQALSSDNDRNIRSRSSLYSKQKLEVYPTSGSIGLAKGLPISVKEGEVYPIEVLISEIPGGSYYQALYIERLDNNNQPLDPNPDRFTLFRTTLDLPEQPKGNMFPQFNPYGPIFRVVRSTTSSGGGSGSGSGILGSRTTPRTARVNEDDDDLSL